MNRASDIFCRYFLPDIIWQIGWKKSPISIPAFPWNAISGEVCFIQKRELEILHNPPCKYFWTCLSPAFLKLCSFLRKKKWLLQSFLLSKYVSLIQSVSGNTATWSMRQDVTKCVQNFRWFNSRYGCQVFTKNCLWSGHRRRNLKRKKYLLNACGKILPCGLVLQYYQFLVTGYLWTVPFHMESILIFN